MLASDITLPTKTIGFIVNPVAGMGGSVGLKGTDGKDTLNKALSLGAKPMASTRAIAFLSELSTIKNSVKLFVGAGDMGQIQAEKTSFKYKVMGESKLETSSEDTMAIAQEIVNAGVDLLIFCGGDGTTRDIFNAIKMEVPVLGVPTGVKMHSAIFAVSPQAAARVSIQFLWYGLPLREAEVMDVDEQAFREGRLSAELYGYLLMPYEPQLIQANKMASPATESELRNQAAIAVYVIEEMKEDIMYVIGPGTTTRAIGDLLDAKKTLLGVDIFFNKVAIASDVNEKQILETINGKPSKIIVTPIGGQGFIFGRGNQQISGKVIREIGLDNIIVVATKGKLSKLEKLRVDTGNPELDREFRMSRIRVLTDYKTTQEIAVE